MRMAFLAWQSLRPVAVGGVAAHVTERAAAPRGPRGQWNEALTPGLRRTTNAQMPKGMPSR